MKLNSAKFINLASNFTYRDPHLEATKFGGQICKNLCDALFKPSCRKFYFVELFVVSIFAKILNIQKYVEFKEHNELFQRLFLGFFARTLADFSYLGAKREVKTKILRLDF